MLNLGYPSPLSSPLWLLLLLWHLLVLLLYWMWWHNQKMMNDDDDACCCPMMKMLKVQMMLLPCADPLELDPWYSSCEMMVMSIQFLFSWNFLQHYPNPLHLKTRRQVVSVVTDLSFFVRILVLPTKKGDNTVKLTSILNNNPSFFLPNHLPTPFLRTHLELLDK